MPGGTAMARAGTGRMGTERLRTRRGTRGMPMEHKTGKAGRRRPSCTAGMGHPRFGHCFRR